MPDSQGQSEQAIKAEELLGAPAADDWKLEPGAHAIRLDDRAGALKNVLEHSAIKEIMRRYVRHDVAATAQQTIYKKYGRAEIYLGSAAAILGAIVLLMTDSENLTPVSNTVRNFLLAIQIGCAAGVGGLKYLLRQRKPFISWQKMRSEAETARIELFETVCGLTQRKWLEAVSPGNEPLLPLQLEYFIRYQLMVQLFYYDKRGTQHQLAANKYIGFGAMIIFFATLAAAFMGYLQDLGDKVSIASMAVLAAPILMTAQTSLSRLNQDERNAARYAITFAHLDRLYGRLSDIRAEAAAGNTEAVHAFIRDVNAVVSVEHNQWNIQQSETTAAVTLG